MKHTADHRHRTKTEIIISDLKICYHCKNAGLSSENKFCPNCSFPQFGTQLEQRKFILNFRKQKTKIRKTKNSTSRARNMLFFSGLIVFFMFYGWTPIITFIGVILLLIYVGLGIWSIKKPLPALLTGLIFFVTLNTFFAIIDIRLLLGTLIFNIAILLGLLFGVFSIINAERIKQEINYKST